MTKPIDQPSILSLATPQDNLLQALLRRCVTTLGPSLLGGVIALLIGAGLIVIAGADPLTSYQAMLEGAFGGSRQWTETILRMCPLLIIGLGLAVSFQGRVWNIGAEGQYYLGALFGGFVALQFPNVPAVILLPSMLLAGLVGGALWGLIPALLRTRRGISEIISTLMLNYIAILLLTYLARGPLQDPQGYLPESAQLVEAAQLPTLFDSRLHWGVVIALTLMPLVYVLIWRTPLGFRLRAIGANANVARFAGINVEWGIIFCLLFSGALAGLAGIIEISSYHLRLRASISGGYGFSGILVALLGRMHPLGILLAALFFAALTIGAESMHSLSGLPAALSEAIQALIVLFVLGVDAYFRLRRS